MATRCCVLASLLVVIISGCFGSASSNTRITPPGEELKNIMADQHDIANPSKDRAEATGRGCGPSRQDAIKTALRVARFNLRSLTGNARYKVDSRIIKEEAGQEIYCVEMAARAKP